MSIVTQVDLLKKRRTKIVATVGPASDSPEMIHRLIAAGVNVFRLNMSHGDHAFHQRVYQNIRKAADDRGEALGILADLCGPKIRTGRFRDGQIELRSGSHVIITTSEVLGGPGLIPSQYKNISVDVKRGDRILLDDGALELQVVGVEDDDVACTVIHGGILRDHKGINLPGVSVSAPSLTDKDREDALFALRLGVDFVALSFVRSAADITDLRSLMEAEDCHAQIIAKIEKPEALQNAEEILQATDAIMIARGDLGVELPPEEVPMAQNQLITMARKRFRPVIVATQMLESMINSARPTRAEVTDISHAVTSGADAVMLSAETASGRFPEAAVQMMDRIARQTEALLWRSGSYGMQVAPEEPPLPIWSVIANATAHMSKDLMAHAVLVISQSGTSATTVSSARPAAPVVAITKHPDVCRKMALLWGVIPVLAYETGKANPNELGRRVAKELELAASGEYVLLVRGFHANKRMNTPSVTVISV